MQMFCECFILHVTTVLACRYSNHWASDTHNHSYSENVVKPSATHVHCPMSPQKIIVWIRHCIRHDVYIIGKYVNSTKV